MSNTKVIPIEPTAAMLDVAVSFALNVQIGRDYNWSAHMAEVYRRMVSAAPYESVASKEESES